MFSCLGQLAGAEVFALWLVLLLDGACAWLEAPHDKISPTLEETNAENA